MTKKSKRAIKQNTADQELVKKDPANTSSITQTSANNLSIKQLLVANAGVLSSLPEMVRPILAGGSESVVLIDGDEGNEVLLVTRKHLGKNIELLHGLPLAGQPFVKPRIVAIDADLALLMDPKAKARARKIAKEQGAVFYPELWSTNVVYSLPRYDGTLEDLKSLAFTETCIKNLEMRLTKALKFLHAHGITHNDIAMKNIFYKGKYPDLQFYLGDFGGLSKNTKSMHELKCRLDNLRMAHVIEKVKEILAYKNKIRKKHDDSSQKHLRMYNNRLRARLGISPIKSPTPIVPEKMTPKTKMIAKKLGFK